MENALSSLFLLYNSFYRFESIEDAEYAQKKLNRTRLGDKMLHVDFAQGDRKSTNSEIKKRLASLLYTSSGSNEDAKRIHGAAASDRGD